MCFPWDTDLQTEVINNLLPSFASEWHVLYANGVCGWHIQHDATPGKLMQVIGNTTETPPWFPGAVPVYCDLFALRDYKGVHHPHHDVFLIPGQCAAPSPRQMGCRFVGGEAVVPVEAAFGGWGMYWQGLFRGGVNASIAGGGNAIGWGGSAEPCRYASTGSEPCEHVPLSRCVREQFEAKQLIASRLVVNWEGCTVTEQQRWDEAVHMGAPGYSYDSGAELAPGRDAM